VLRHADAVPFVQWIGVKENAIRRSDVGHVRSRTKYGNKPAARHLRGAYRRPVRFDSAPRDGDLLTRHDNRLAKPSLQPNDGYDENRGSRKRKFRASQTRAFHGKTPSFDELNNVPVASFVVKTDANDLKSIDAGWHGDFHPVAHFLANEPLSQRA
jgi:hypothetical protein